MGRIMEIFWNPGHCYCCKRHKQDWYPLQSITLEILLIVFFKSSLLFSSTFLFTIADFSLFLMSERKISLYIWVLSIFEIIFAVLSCKWQLFIVKEYKCSQCNADNIWKQQKKPTRVFVSVLSIYETFRDEQMYNIKSSTTEQLIGTEN